MAQGRLFLFQFCGAYGICLYQQAGQNQSGWLLQAQWQSAFGGIVLSTFWRRTGNIAVPGFSHAFADAIRDGLK